MKITIIKLCLLFVLTSIFFKNANAQSAMRCVKKARRAVERYNYVTAKQNYIKALKKDSLNYKANFELALLLHHQLNNVEESGMYYLRAEKKLTDDIDIRVIYGLAQHYQYAGNYGKAISYYSKIENLKLDIPELQYLYRVKKEIANCNYALGILKQESKYSKYIVKNIGSAVNTIYPEYVPVVNYNDSSELFYTARLKNNSLKKRIDYKDDQFYEGVFIAKKSNQDGYSNRITFVDSINVVKNKSIHESVVGFSKDGKKLIVFKDNKLFLKKKEGSSFSANIDFGEEINFSEYVNHASLTADEKIIYFSAEKKDNGFGGIDIYQSNKNDDGRWGTATNLGEVINTSSDDQSPEISPDGKTLYFSSTGHLGFGGYDVFKTTFDEKKWTTPINIGQPINSAGDDIHLKFNLTETDAFFASSRNGGVGDMDIYYLTTEKPINDSIYSDISAINNSIKISAKDSLEKNSLTIVNTTGGSGAFDLKFIYFDFDKYDIRKDAKLQLEENLSILKKYPNVKIKISAHCDSRGTEKYNLKLSNKRAKSTINYLVKNGLDKSRIISTSKMGETLLVNKCNGSSPCTARDHQLNRRIEFKLVIN